MKFEFKEVPDYIRLLNETLDGSWLTDAKVDTENLPDLEKQADVEFLKECMDRFVEKINEPKNIIWINPEISKRLKEEFEHEVKCENTFRIEQTLFVESEYLPDDTCYEMPCSSFKFQPNYIEQYCSLGEARLEDSSFISGLNKK